MGYKTGWMKKFINNVSTKVFAYAHVKTVYKDYANGTTLDDVLIETEDFDQSAVTESEISPVILSKINAVATQTSNNFTLLNANKAESTEVYTREEIDNLISALKQECDWKEAVETFDDLATTYPDAEEGWTVTVKDTNIIYRYNGTAWVDIYTMIKLATESNDGLMSKADYSKLKGIEAGAQINTITGVKGNAESSYRTGDVNLTPENLGALPADKLETKFNEFILNKLYPVGSIYLETTNTNPSSKLGGTWVAYGSSDTYLRLGGNGSGGSNTVKLNANQIPSITTGNESNGHTHTFSWSGSHTHQTYNTTSDSTVTTAYNNDTNVYLRTGAITRNTSDTTINVSGTTSDKNSYHTHTFTNNNQQNVNITPKYVQVYAWKRTA